MKPDQAAWLAAQLNEHDIRRDWGPLITCPVCNGARFVAPTGEYETLFVVGGKEMRQCPLCWGTGTHRERLSVDEKQERSRELLGREIEP